MLASATKTTKPISSGSDKAHGERVAEWPGESDRPEVTATAKLQYDYKNFK